MAANKRRMMDVENVLHPGKVYRVDAEVMQRCDGLRLQAQHGGRQGGEHVRKLIEIGDDADRVAGRTRRQKRHRPRRPGRRRDREADV